MRGRETDRVAGGTIIACGVLYAAAAVLYVVGWLLSGSQAGHPHALEHAVFAASAAVAGVLYCLLGLRVLRGHRHSALAAAALTAVNMLVLLWLYRTTGHFQVSEFVFLAGVMLVALLRYGQGPRLEGGGRQAL